MDLVDLPDEGGGGTNNGRGIDLSKIVSSSSDPITAYLEKDLREHGFDADFEGSSSIQAIDGQNAGRVWTVWGQEGGACAWIGGEEEGDGVTYEVGGIKDTGYTGDTGTPKSHDGSDSSATITVTPQVDTSSRSLDEGGSKMSVTESDEVTEAHTGTGGGAITGGADNVGGAMNDNNTGISDKDSDALSDWSGGDSELEALKGHRRADFTKPFMYLKPSNLDASISFSLATGYLRNKLSEQYCSVYTSHNAVTRFGDPWHVNGHGQLTTPTYYDGYLTMDLNKPRKAGRTLKWKLGPVHEELNVHKMHGEENVDVAVGLLGKKESLGCATEILELNFDHDSRALMAKPIGHAVRVNGKVVKPGEESCLGQEYNRVLFGKMEWIFEWAIKDYQEATRFAMARDAEMAKVGVPRGENACLGVPLAGDRNFPDLFRGQQHSPHLEFGQGWKGFNPVNGRAVAAKVVHIIKSEDHRQICHEIIAIGALAGLIGVIDVIGIRGYREVTAFSASDQMEVTFITPPVTPWNMIDWNQHDWQTKVALAKNVMEGIAAIHGEGMLHRNVTAASLFVLFNPTRAVVGGLSEARLGLLSTEPCVAEPSDLPPYITETGDKVEGRLATPQTEEVDVFMCGMSIAKSYFKHAFAGRWNFCRKGEFYKVIQRFENKHGPQGLRDTLMEMMAVEREKAPRMTSILRDARMVQLEREFRAA